jgi:hypothetical protein
MVSREAVKRSRYSMAVVGRYDEQERLRVGGVLSNIRKDWTPAQKRRMKKKLKGSFFPYLSKV